MARNQHADHVSWINRFRGIFLCHSPTWPCFCTEQVVSSADIDEQPSLSRNMRVMNYRFEFSLKFSIWGYMNYVGSNKERITKHDTINVLTGTINNFQVSFFSSCHLIQSCRKGLSGNLKRVYERFRNILLSCVLFDTSLRLSHNAENGDPTFKSQRPFHK